MITGFVIWSLVSLIFLGIGCSSWKSKESVGFFTGVKPAQMKDVTAYNRAVAKIWFVFAGLLEIVGIPLLFLEQNSPLCFIVVFAVLILVFAIIVAYIRVEAKYRQ